MPASKIIFNIGVLATAMGRRAKAGREQGDIMMLENAYIALEGEKISFIGTGDIDCALIGADTQFIDAKERLVTAGLVDAHTHLVFGGWREHELSMKLKGVAYLDILKAGGGILSTVRSTRAATKDELKEKTLEALKAMLVLGTTTCEAKSGYGLSLDDEVKQLNVVKELSHAQPVELVSTFMAAHAVPEEYKNDKEAYIKLIIDEMLPYVNERGLAEFCDVFCETGVFSADESRRILSAAKSLGMGLKIHADEIDAIGGAELAGELNAVSAEHLIAARKSGIDSMANGGTIAVLLPATSFYLGKDFAPARLMIESGVPVAVASDFNPGSTPNLSLQLPMNIACYKYAMTPEEVLTAVTLNAAAAINRAETLGTLEVGKQADILIWNAPNLDRIFYRYGSNQVDTVIKKGNIIVMDGKVTENVRLKDMRVCDFIDLLASEAPAPGGGSASALAGAMGISLAAMTARLTVGKPKYAEYDELMKSIIAKTSPMVEQMTNGIDKDTDAYNVVSGVFKMPKSNDEEKAARKAAMQSALKNAALVPFELLENCERALMALTECVGTINPNCYSDLGSGAANLRSAAQGAWLNVLINIGGLADKEFAADLKERGQKCISNCYRLADEAFNRIQALIEG